MTGADSRRDTPPVWAVGGNSRGQLGQGTPDSSIFVPRRVAFQLAPTQWIIEVFCGYEHTFALTSDGDVVGFGSGGKGQLGIGNTESHSTPQRVHLLSGKGVVKMAAGQEHSLALTESGDLYAFGDNLSGQLGLGHNFTAKEQTPQRVPRPSLSRAKITQLACGQYHTAVLTSLGELYMFGNNRDGSLGVAGHANEGPPIVASAPQLVTGLKGKQVVQIGCGQQHTVALTAGGSVYCWGGNSKGQLGTGDNQNRYTPSLVGKPLSSAKCIHVACGGKHTIAVTEGDDVYGFGSDRYGQLGLGRRALIVPLPTRIVRLGGRRVTNCVAGASHTIVTTVGGEQYIMGRVIPFASAEEGRAGAAIPIATRNTNPAIPRNASVATGVASASASDPFALSCGEFRRLLLPRGSQVASKGDSLFYGQGLGTPPCALRKVVQSRVRLKSDFSRMLVRQRPDVVFIPHAHADSESGNGAPSDRSAGGNDRSHGCDGCQSVGAHLAVLRARCPSLYNHAAAALSRQAKEKPEKAGDIAGDKAGEGDHVPTSARHVCSPDGVPLETLQLVICYLYQDDGVFDKRKTENAENASYSSSDPLEPHANSNKSEPTRVRDRLTHIFPKRKSASSSTSTSGAPDEDDEEMPSWHGAAEMSGDPWDEGGEGEHETAAGFGSLGSAYGSNGAPYDGAGLDRLMRLMAAARTLKLPRLQGLCEKRAEAFIGYRTVHKVLRRAAEGEFPYLKRRCLEFCLMHLREVCAPGNSSEVVRELSKHPQVLSDVLSLSAASDRARVAAANEEPFDGPGAVPCIEALRSETACAVPEEDYQGDFLALFQDVVAKSVSESEGGQALDKADANHRRRSAQSAGPVTSFAQGKLKRDPLPAGDDADDAHEDSTSVAQGKGSGEAKGNGKPKAEFENIGGPLAEAKGDFMIRAGEGLPAVTVHKSILAARSGFFRALLEGGMGDATQGGLTLKFEPVVGMSALLEFLRFLYTGRSGAMEPLTALDVLFLTKGEHGSGGFFQIIGTDELRAYCTSTLFDGIDVDNALPILVRAKALGDDHALHSAIDFILQNFDGCMVNSKTPDDSKSGSEDGRLEDEDDPMAVSVPACLEDDESPAVDLLLALAKRCTVKMKPKTDT